MVVPQTQPAGDAFTNLTEAFADALANRLQRFEPRPALGRMEADELDRKSTRLNSSH